MINWETAEFMYETGGMSYEDAIRAREGEPEVMKITSEEIANKIWEHLNWNGMEIWVIIDYEDMFEYGFRDQGSWGGIEFEESITGVLPLDADYWFDTLSDWGIDPDEMENTPEDLKEQFITDVIKDKLLEIALRKRPWPGV